MARRACGTDSCVLVLYAGGGACRREAANLQARCNQRRAHVVHPVSAGNLPAAAPRERARGRRGAVGAGRERGGAPRRERGFAARRMQTLPVRWRAPASRWHWYAPARELTLCQLWATAQRRRAARTEHEITRGTLRACEGILAGILPARAKKRRAHRRAAPGAGHSAHSPGARLRLPSAGLPSGRASAQATAPRRSHFAQGGARTEDASGACHALAGGSALRLSQPWAP